MNTRAPWISRNPLLTAFLVALWLALVIYAFASGDPLAWVLAGVFLFTVAVPTAVVYISAWRAAGKR
jgi:small-conductance mechanosensitive channel